MQTELPAWYCARTKPKHEHIAAAGVSKNLKLEVFQPQLKIEKATLRGVIRVTEPLFPCYIFVRCVIAERMDDIQYTTGVSHFVRFGQKIPVVADAIIEELQQWFSPAGLMTIEDQLAPGDEVTVADGAFAGASSRVLRMMPARQRIQILLDVLGRPTPVEVERSSVVLVRNSLAQLAPALAAPR